MSAAISAIRVLFLAANLAGSEHLQLEAEADTTGTWYAFLKVMVKRGGGKGWDDVWKRGHFAWECKQKGRTYQQRLLYREALLIRRCLWSGIGIKPRPILQQQETINDRNRSSSINTLPGAAF